MQKIIKDNHIIEDQWNLIRLTDEGMLPSFGPDEDVIVPLACWLDAPERWKNRTGKTGIWLSPSDEPEQLAPFLKECPVIAVDFPGFTDGRGYSLARLLRERYSYAGEIRAVGELWEDVIQALWRVGFNAFEVRQGKSIESCLKVLSISAERYQSDFRQPVPSFRRNIDRC